MASPPSSGHPASASSPRLLLLPGRLHLCLNLAYSDAGLLTIQLNGAAASVRKGAESVVSALKSVADGSVSKEDVTKAVANAKFEVLEKGQLRDSSIMLAGGGIVNNGKAVDIAAVTKSFDGVTADKLKTVSFDILYFGRPCDITANAFIRPPRLSLRARLLFLPSVTSLSCPTPRTLACEYRWICYSAQACTNSQGGLDGGGSCFSVNICSRNPICSKSSFSRLRDGDGYL